MDVKMLKTKTKSTMQEKKTFMQNQNRKCFKNITFWCGYIRHSLSSFFSDCTLFNNDISQYQRGLLNLRHDRMLLMNTLAFLLDNHSCQSRKSTEFSSICKIFCKAFMAIDWWSTHSMENFF